MHAVGEFQAGSVQADSTLFFHNVYLRCIDKGCANLVQDAPAPKGK